MVCLGFEPGAAGWQAQTDPLSYGGTPRIDSYFRIGSPLKSYSRDRLKSSMTEPIARLVPRHHQSIRCQSKNIIFTKRRSSKEHVRIQPCQRSPFELKFYFSTLPNAMLNEPLGHGALQQKEVRNLTALLVDLPHLGSPKMA